MPLVDERIEEIPSDGSDRRFFRGQWRGVPAIVIHPSPGGMGRAEAASYVRIGRHLWQAKVPVPEIYYHDPEGALVVVEDVGDRSLQTTALGQADKAVVGRLYRKALSVLAHQQVSGAPGFDPTWCLDTPFYDSRLALEREALYFLRFFVQRLCGRSASPGLEADLGRLAACVDLLPERRYFLHRDYQSRNLFLQGERVRVIDFQGGRLGPLGYDVAALLVDPYVALPTGLWPGLLDHYLEALSGLGLVLDKGAFSAEFRLLAVLRTLQVLGAYAYLQLMKGKAFFAAYVSPAINALRGLLHHEDFQPYPHLRRAVAELASPDAQS